MRRARGVGANASVLRSHASVRLTLALLAFAFRRFSLLGPIQGVGQHNGGMDIRSFVLVAVWAAASSEWGGAVGVVVAGCAYILAPYGMYMLADTIERELQALRRDLKE